MGEVAPDQRHLVMSSQLEKRVEQRLDVSGAHGSGQRERQHRHARRGTHGRQVTEADGECLEAEISRPRKGELEVDAFNQRVGGDDVQGAPLRFPPPPHHRRYRPGSLAGPAAHAPDPVEEPMLTKLSNGQLGIELCCVTKRLGNRCGVATNYRA